MSSTEISNTDNAPLTEAQKARINRNRERALHLKAAKLTSHPYAKAYVLLLFILLKLIQFYT